MNFGGYCLALVIWHGVAMCARAAEVPVLVKADKASVSFSVEEAAGVARSAWPLTFGVPFAPGQLKSADGVQVVANSGKALPTSARIAASWRDGSVKWLHVDCQADLRKNSKEEFTLNWGQGTAPRAACELKISKNGEGITVDTGAITFTLSPTGGGIPENVKLAGGEVLSKGGSHTLSFVETAPPPNAPEARGNWKRPLPDGATPIELSATNSKAEVQIEQQSPLAATILVRGWYEGGGRKACKFDVRVTAFAGKSYLKIQHTLTYTEDPEKFFVCGLDYSLGFPGATKAQLGGVAAHEVSPEKEAYLLAVGPEINHNGVLLANAFKKAPAYDLFEGGTKSANASGKNPAGYAALQSGKGGIAVSVRDFALLQPKELCVDAKGVNVGLWPSHARLLIDCRNPRFGERVRSETTLNGCGTGWAKTHELWVAYHDAKGQNQALDFVRAGQAPAYAAVNPKQVCDSGAMGVIAPVNRKEFPGLERQHDTLFAWELRNQEVFHWDGFFNYGGLLIEFSNHGQRLSGGPPETWCWRDYAGWILNDGQEAHQAWRAFARSGDRRLIILAESISRCIGDESTVHFFNPQVLHAHPIGGAHRHDMSPWGTIITTYSMDVLGNCDLWYFTGDLRAKDVLRDYAANLRTGGQGLIESHGVASLVARMGEALGDPKLIDDARKLVKSDIDEASNMVGFRSWTDLFMPMILAMDILPDEDLKKPLLAVADKFVEGAKFQYLDADYLIHPVEVLAWAYLTTKDRKYLPTMLDFMRNFGGLTVAKAHEGDPFAEDWPTLRKRMDEMPYGAVKTYINFLCVGRYPALIRALQAAGLSEKDALAGTLK